MGTSSGSLMSFCASIVCSASWPRSASAQWPRAPLRTRFLAALPDSRRSSLVAGRSGGAAGGRADPGELDSVIGPPNLASLSLSVNL